MLMKGRRPRILVLEAGSDSGVDVVHELEVLGADVYPADSDPHCRVGTHPNFRTVSDGTTPEYLDEVDALCTLRGIDFIAPTLFHQANAIAELRPGLHTGSAYFYDDKVHYASLRHAGLPVAETKGAADGWFRFPGHAWNPDLPCVRKPRLGKGSRGIHFETASRARDNAISWDAGWVIQPRLEGQQYTVDVLTHPVTGAFVHACVRKVHLLRHGTDTVATVLPSRHPLEDVAVQLANHIRWTGPANFEAIGDEHGNYAVIDINPRFSAGFRMSEAVGYSMVRNWLQGLLEPQLALAPGPLRRRLHTTFTRRSYYEKVREAEV